ncbi:2-amino-3,7-dideoxy-D-threo-hept-6-ulosonate synthase [Acetivibrio cellulolyticus]|uniref:2-amino-3,7-dideoxy-D-threo-hept-6-ulosonate synthase n=1 Tax=Acetivibrio cellulolyticus TaxID=35830 RepID=UPI0001E2FAEC|nr:2-amino-3,7-dideoxy-D-threo-hept-6-ulosonate synthase [Acetivibrio cellulolyticus]
MYGKSLRLSRIMNIDTGRTCIVPMDHGVTLGPIDGIQDYVGTITQILSGGADAIVLHKGLLKSVASHTELSKGRYIMHLSASTSLSNDSTHKVLTGSVEEAVKLGADGVSVHVNLGVWSEGEMTRDLGIVARDCMEWGMPLLVMIYTHKNPKDINAIMHSARVAEELGADIVKIGYPGSFENTEKLIRGVGIPVVIAGGAKMDSVEKLMCTIDDALNAGASGVAIGRNVFQHKNPGLITDLISKLIHRKLKLGQCLSMLEELEGAYAEECRV